MISEHHRDIHAHTEIDTLTLKHTPAFYLSNIMHCKLNLTLT